VTRLILIYRKWETPFQTVQSLSLAAFSCLFTISLCLDVKKMRDEIYFDFCVDLEFKVMPLFRESVSAKNCLPQWRSSRVPHANSRFRKYSKNSLPNFLTEETLGWTATIGLMQSISRSMARKSENGAGILLDKGVQFDRRGLLSSVLNYPEVTFFSAVSDSIRCNGCNLTYGLPNGNP